MSEQKEYCVVAADRETGKREPLTGGMSKSTADRELGRMKVEFRKTHKYFHVAAYPYVARRHGGGRW